MSDAPPDSLLVLRGVATLDARIVDVEIAGGNVTSVRPASDRRHDDATVLDGAGLTLVPGFIDLQANGAAGHDITADPTTIWDVGRALLPYGVTAFLPTIVTS